MSPPKTQSSSTLVFTVGINNRRSAHLYSWPGLFLIIGGDTKLSLTVRGKTGQTKLKQTGTGSAIKGSVYILDNYAFFVSHSSFDESRSAENWIISLKFLIDLLNIGLRLHKKGRREIESFVQV